MADTDECADPETIDACGAHATCVNTDGSYDCDCDSGYEWDGHACRGQWNFRQELFNQKNSATFDNISL